MKRLLLTTAIASALVLGGCIIVVDEGKAQARHSSADRMAGGDIQSTLDERGDFSISGGDLDLSGNVDGQLSLAGADIRLSRMSLGALDASAADLSFQGSVRNDVEANAADINWTGAIGGSAAFNAADLVFEGSAGGPLRANIADGRLTGQFQEVRINGADLVFEQGADVRGGFQANVADFIFRGTAHDGLDLDARYVDISGTVTGPLEIQADPGRVPHGRRDGLVDISGTVEGGGICARRVVISGTVTGPLAITADEPAVIEPGANAGNVSYTPRNGQRCERS